jgi:hypothetical protein
MLFFMVASALSSLPSSRFRMRSRDLVVVSFRDGFLGGAGQQFGPEVPREGFFGVGQRAGNGPAALDDTHAIAFTQKRRDGIRVRDVIGELLVIVLEGGCDELRDGRFGHVGSP